MAIEIKELSINVKVNSDAAGTNEETAATGEMPDARIVDRLVEECVQRVLDELSYKKEGR